MSTRLATASAMAPPEPPSPMITPTSGTADLQAGLDRARDRLGLAALLGVDAGIGARRVDQRHDRQAEAVGQLHQADRLAIAFRVGHAEIVAHAALGVGALLVAEHDHRAAAEARQAALIARSSPNARSPASGM